MSKELFSRLKTALKARGLTYADIAKRLEVSEITIKRIFAEQDCKLSRLSAICRAADLQLQELIEAAEQNLSPPNRLSVRQSQALSANRSLLSVFLLLLNRYAPARIQAIHQLTDQVLYRYLRTLEQLQLIQLTDTNTVKLLIEPPVDFLAHQSLDQLIREINEDFLCWVFNHRHSTGYRFESVSRHMSRASAEEIYRDISELNDKIKRLARRDHLLVPSKELSGYKLSCAFGLTPFDRLFSVRAQDAPDLAPSAPHP
ncbi:helix-turn-helix domain-containing protein [Marinobacterium rhizophilum]|uniref:helix-turn-helix domain-containing protein n=1 Tax=Marinobacterium rhizophilum TaxID=420402 RepID=UPI000372D719|nr:helix-turn-helix transcriptional regulator [Marinobacterium rhizophilum]